VQHCSSLTCTDDTSCCANGACLGPLLMPAKQEGWLCHKRNASQGDEAAQSSLAPAGV
jgi:hypothetical protein